MVQEYHLLTDSKRTRSATLRAALALAEKGIPVFPVGANKQPLTPKGFKDATTDPARITAFWNAHPSANIGVPTGPASGWFVVDIDLDNGGLETLAGLHERFGSVFAAPTVNTGGGGFHFYFTLPPDSVIPNSAGRLGAGVDVRGAGGYVLVPPSFTTGAYEWTGARAQTPPPGLVELLQKQPDRGPNGSKRVERSSVGTTVGVGGTADGPIPEGERNQTLFFSALDSKEAGKDRAQALHDISTLNVQRCAPPLGDAEVEKIVASAYRYPLRGRRTPPEVEEALAGLRRAWWSTAWRRTGGQTERDLLMVLLRWARRYGHCIPSGVRVSISFRDLALAAGVGLRTVTRAVHRLKVGGWVRGDNANRVGADAGALVLLPRQGDHTQSKGGIPGDGSVVSTARPPCPSPNLPERTPCFRVRGFVGKAKASALYAMEVFGPQTDEEIAVRLGYSRVRDVRSKLLKPLILLGLVVVAQGGEYALHDAYDQRVDALLKAKYGGGERKVREPDPAGTGRVVTHVVYTPASSEFQRAEAERRTFADQRRRHRERMATYGRRTTEELRQVVA